MPTGAENLPALVPEQENLLQPVTLDVLSAMERSRIEMQISAARANPRPDIDVIEASITRRATRRVDIAELCYYSLPRWDKEEQKNKLIHGATIKLANIALGEYRNTLSGAITTANDGKVIRATGICWDLENNNQKYLEAQRRIVDKNGRPYKYDMQIQMAGACISIAERNAILKVLGDDLFVPAFRACMKKVAGTASDLIERRDRALKWFSFRGVKYDQILELLDKDAVDKLDVDDVAYLSGLANAIKDKELTVEEAFGKASGEEEPDVRKGKLRELTEERRAQKEAEKSKEKS